MNIFRYKIIIPLVIFLIGQSFSSCNIDSKYQWRNRAVKHYNEHIPYDLLRPVENFKLHPSLLEISGLTTTPEGHLACIEDETGYIYFLDENSGEILRKEKFHQYGDYEGIAYADSAFYIAKSNGKIYKWQEGKEVDKRTTALGNENNVEGFCYDPLSDIMLMACKEIPGIDDLDMGLVRAIYAYHYKNDSLDEVPKFIVSVEDVMAFVTDNFGTGESIPNILFKPSGIAIHPIDGSIYIINYIGRILIVLNPNGTLQSVLPLSIQHFSQPEGICFDKEANLYISNEGGDQHGYILKYPYKKI